MSSVSKGVAVYVSWKDKMDHRHSRPDAPTDHNAQLAGLQPVGPGAVQLRLTEGAGPEREGVGVPWNYGGAGGPWNRLPLVPTGEVR